MKECSNYKKYCFASSGRNAIRGSNKPKIEDITKDRFDKLSHVII